MSVILNETKVYPGWERPNSTIVTEEKALLINVKQNFIFTFAKVGASAGLLLGTYTVINKYNIVDEYFSFSEMLTIVAFYVLTAGLAGYLCGLFFARLYRK